MGNEKGLLKPLQRGITDLSEKREKRALEPIREWKKMHPKGGGNGAGSQGGASFLKGPSTGKGSNMGLKQRNMRKRMERKR